MYRIKGMLADCQSRLVDGYLTNHDYESKGQEFACTLSEDLSPVSNTHDFNKRDDIHDIHILDI